MSKLIPLPKIKTDDLNSILSSLTNSEGSKLLTPNQVNDLMSLQFSDGELMLTLEDRYFVYEVVNMVNSIGYDATYNFLSVDWIAVFGPVYDIRDKIILVNPLLEQAKMKQLMDLEVLTGQIEVSKGDVDCRRCGSEETISVSKQSRSSDEPMTIKVTCLQCRYKWTAQ